MPHSDEWFSGADVSHLPHTTKHNMPSSPSNDELLASFLPGFWRSADSLLAAGINVGLASRYSFATVDAMPPELQRELGNIIEAYGAIAFILPDIRSSLAAIPLRPEHLDIFQAISTGCPWNEVACALSIDEIRRLFAAGVLSGRLGDTWYSGPAIPLLVDSLNSSQDMQILHTDPLSSKCLSHAASIPLHEVGELASRLYLFNHHGVYDSTTIDLAVSGIKQIISRQVEGFNELPQSPHNPGWHFFASKSHAGRRGAPEQVTFKVYVSPRVEDTARCLAELVAILPALSCHMWKIGRGAYGATRADKICIYFEEQETATTAAHLLAKEITSIQSQGIPFTYNLDASGLVSMGVDPPRPTSGPSSLSGTSWRDWITQKLATSLSIAKRHPQYPLSPEQTALYSMKFLGIEPSVWRIEDRDFWRT